MIPKRADDIKYDFQTTRNPNRTDKLDLDREELRGEIDGLESVEQAVYLILGTERYKYEIYSWDYGIELVDLIGKPIPLVFSLIKQRICEALIWDDRIISVDNFSFNHNKSKVNATFTVGTIFGSFNATREVAV